MSRSAALSSSAGRALELLDAVLQADDAGAEVAGEVDVVDVAEHRDVELAGDLADEGHHLARDLRVEARGRLVDQQQLRVLDQGAGDADALALAAGEAVGALVDVLGEADPVEQAQRLGDVVLGVHAQDAAQRAGVAEPAGQHVVHHREPLDQVELLEDHADVAALQPHLGIGELEQVDAVEHDLAAGRLDQPVDAADQRRLAGAARADDGEEVIGPEREAHPLQDLAPGVAGAQVLHLQDGLHRPAAYLPPPASRMTL